MLIEGSLQGSKNLSGDANAQKLSIGDFFIQHRLCYTTLGDPFGYKV